MEYVLKTNALTKSYGRFTALTGLSMNVPTGSIYGLVGKNGAGKTTLIRIICGLQKQTSGEYTLYSRKSCEKGIERSRRRMGAVVETPALALDMTARENLRQQYRILGLPSFEGIDELLELVGLSDTGKKKARSFSLGMRGRLAIAIALAGDPELLVLDEPTNGLDPQGFIEIRELILRLNRERGVTVLISSHILSELSRLATHYGFIDSGSLVRELSADELEAACRKCVRLEVDDTKKLTRVLDRSGLEYTIISEKLADVYSKPKLGELAAALTAEGGSLISANERDEGLEGFYINLVGGMKNA